MQESRPTYQLLDALVDAMTGGRVRTSPTFVCPNCFGPASASASACGGVLFVSVRCPCTMLELDGVPKWPGWESLLSPPPPGFVADPLKLTHRKQKKVGFALHRRRGETSPCPHCGAPLATREARQCFVCGMDWHDVQNVVSRLNPDRNPHGLVWRTMYVAELCQGADGNRYVRYFAADGGTPDPHRVFHTPAHPGWRWVAWGEHGFAGDVETTTGVEFTFDATGVWLTWDEVRGLHRHLRGEVAWADVPWAAAVPPQYAPR